VLPLLTGYFVWKRRLDDRTLRWLAAAFVPRRLRQRLSVRPGRLTEVLTALHLPIALWVVWASRTRAAGGARWRPHGLHSILGRALHLLRADRLGGGVLTAFMAMSFRPSGSTSSRSSVVAAAVRREPGPSWSPRGWSRRSRA
jgi:hypothetical protein